MLPLCILYHNLFDILVVIVSLNVPGLTLRTVYSRVCVCVHAPNTGNVSWMSYYRVMFTYLVDEVAFHDKICYA